MDQPQILTLENRHHISVKVKAYCLRLIYMYIKKRISISLGPKNHIGLLLVRIYLLQTPEGVGVANPSFRHSWCPLACLQIRGHCKTLMLLTLATALALYHFQKLAVRSTSDIFKPRDAPLCFSLFLNFIFAARYLQHHSCCATVKSSPLKHTPRVSDTSADEMLSWYAAQQDRKDSKFSHLLFCFDGLSRRTYFSASASP